MDLTRLKLPLRPSSPACWGRGREAPDGVWPTAAARARLRDRKRDPCQTVPAFRTPSGLRPPSPGVSAEMGKIRRAPHDLRSQLLFGETEWFEAGRRLAEGEATLVSLWGDEGRMRLALREADGGLAVVDMPCDRGAFPSLAALHPPACRLERAACDLYGFFALGAPDGRRWLDHGRWPLRHPLGRSRAPRRRAPTPTPSLRPGDPDCTRFPVGPVHAGIIEPGHFRFHAGGEAVVRLEERLGYTHKGRRRADARGEPRPRRPARRARQRRLRPSPTRSPSPEPSSRRSAPRRRRARSGCAA